MSERVCADCGLPVGVDSHLIDGMRFVHDSDWSCYLACKAALERVTRGRDEAIEALRPFAEWAGPSFDDDHIRDIAVTAGDLRRAAEIVEKAK